MIYKAVIPCAGIGSRMYPVTPEIPKELLPLNEKPALQYALIEADYAGVNEVIIVSNEDKYKSLNSMAIKIKDNYDFKNIGHIRVSVQGKAKGLMGAILTADASLNRYQDLLVILPDMIALQIIYDEDEYYSHWMADSKLMVKNFDNKHTTIGCLFHRYMSRSLYGNVIFRKKTGKVHNIIEKPKYQIIDSELSIGRYILTKDFIRFALAGVEPRHIYQEYCITKAMKKWMSEGNIIKAHSFSEQSRIYGDLGNIESYTDVSRKLF